MRGKDKTLLEPRIKKRRLFQRLPHAFLPYALEQQGQAKETNAFYKNSVVPMFKHYTYRHRYAVIFCILNCW